MYFLVKKFQSLCATWGMRVRTGSQWKMRVIIGPKWGIRVRIGPQCPCFLQKATYTGGPSDEIGKTEALCKSGTISTSRSET